jgi:hypothetical protein
MTYKSLSNTGPLCWPWGGPDGQLCRKDALAPVREATVVLATMRKGRMDVVLDWITALKTPASGPWAHYINVDLLDTSLTR